MPDATDRSHAPRPAADSSAGNGGQRRGDGRLAAAISNMMVGLLRRYQGRGPTHARTSVGRDHVLILLRDTMTTSEKTLAENGYEQLVLDGRRAMQGAMREEATQKLQELTGRRVIGFLSDNQIDPDLAAELFIMEPGEEGLELAEGDATE